MQGEPIPVTLKELALASHSTQREIGRSYRLIISGMAIAPPIPNATRYVERVASKAHASEAAMKLAIEIEKKAIDMELGGRNPMTLAAAARNTIHMPARSRRTPVWRGQARKE